MQPDYWLVFEIRIRVVFIHSRFPVLGRFLKPNNLALISVSCFEYFNSTVVVTGCFPNTKNGIGFLL